MDTVRSSRNVADVVQQLAATLQPTISLEVWGHICAAVLRTIEHDASRVIQSLLKRDTVLQIESPSQQLFCLTSLAAIGGLATPGVPGPALTTTIFSEICVPLLEGDATLLVPRHHQIIQAFSRIVAVGNTWSSALLLLDESAAELQSGTELAGRQTMGVGRLTHQQQCLLVKSLLLSGLHMVAAPGAADKQEVGSFLERCLQLLQPVVCVAVSGNAPAHASHVVSLILPTLCKLAEELGPELAAEFGSILWLTCKRAILDCSQGQAAALTAVVQNITFLMPQTGSSLHASDMRADPTFWAVVRQLLVDDNAFTRKQGLFVLEHAVACLPMPAQQPWQALLQLLALLEDFGLHLIKAAWEPLVLQLHQPPPHSPHQQGTGSMTNGAFQVDGLWLDVVWRRALAHPSPAVQAYMLQSVFLKVPAGGAASPSVPCVLDDVMPAFCRGALNGESVVPSAVAFTRAYAADLDPAAACSFMLGLLRFQTSSHASKLAMPAVLQCTMAAAEASDFHTSTAAPSQWHEEVVAEVKQLVQSAAQECSSAAVSFQTDMLRVVTLVCPPSTVSLASFGALLAQLPLASLQPSASSLRAAQGWLVTGGRTASSYANELMDIFTLYFASDVLPDDGSVQDDAVRLVRLMLLLDGQMKEAHLELVFGQLQEKVAWLTERPYLPKGIADRTLALLKILMEASYQLKLGFCRRAKLTFQYKALNSNQNSQLRSHTVECASNMAAYLRDYALHCCQVFQHPSNVKDYPAKQAKAVVAISAAAQSTLPDTLKKKLSMAHLAVATALQALTLIASDTQTRHSSSAPALELLVDMVVRLMQHALQQRRKPAVDVSADEEVCMEELALVASCCQAIASVDSGRRLPGLQQLPGEDLVVSLLQRRESQDNIQASALRSQSEKAIWQALQSHLMLLQSLNLLTLQPQSVSKLLVAASADAAVVASDVLLPLLTTLRIALEAAAASPAAAHLAARCLSAEGLPQGDDPTQLAVGLGASEASLAASHVACMLSVVEKCGQACWLALSQEEKLRAGHYQALLDTFLCHKLFCQDKPQGLRAAMHRDGGPLQHLVRQVLTAGQQSARLLALAALHLAGLFGQCPSVALLFYLPHIQHLLVCDVRDTSLEGSRLQLQPALGQPTQLPNLHSLDLDVSQHAISVQLPARVAMVCLMHQLVTHKAAPVGELDQDSAQHVAAAEQLGQTLFQNLLRDQCLKPSNYQINSAIHRAKLRHWQALAVLSAFISHTETHHLVAQLWSFLQGKDVASVRQYAESIIVNLVLREPVALMQKHVLPSLLAYHAKPHEGVTSAILVASQVIRHAPAAVQQQLWGPFVSAAWPWTMWHHHAIRTFAQLVLHQLLEDFPEAMPKVSSQEGASATPWGTCMAFFRTNPDMKRLERSLGPGLRTYDPCRAITPAGVLHSGCQLAGGSEESVRVEGAPLTLLQGVTHFLIHQRATLRKEANTLPYQEPEYAAADPGPAGQSILPSTDFQRKMMPLDHLRGPSEGLTGSEESGEHTGQNPASSGRQRQGLIVVASLVDKVPNLAGLSRTCEVFRAAAMVVSDKRVTKDPAFASISVTADQWLPLIEVAESSLPQWMLQKRAEGFTLIGVEQTAESVLLPDFAFPQNSVLLLGREREGIPMQMLQLLDHTVEIPQLGLIRSLNVHVSGAITLYEYSKQQLAQSRQRQAK